MPEVNERDLALVIRAVDFKIADLEQTIATLPPDSDSDVEEELFRYSNTAEALKRAYLEALSKHSNLTPYEKLVRPD